MATCPICDARAHRATIEELAASGGDLQSVKTMLAAKGIKASAFAIKRHFREHATTPHETLHTSILSVALSQKERDARKANAAKRKQEVTEYLDDVATIDLDKVLATIGVRKDPQSMGEVLTLVQRMSLAMHTAASVVAYDRLDRFMRDPEGRRYPSLELRGAKTTSEMVAEAFGYAQAVSVQTAFETVEKAGFRVVEEGAASEAASVADPPQVR
jgi:hypothetical protein